MTPTDSQANAITELQAWIDAPIVNLDDHYRCLEGPAGSGKSTAVKLIIDKYNPNTVICAAPTHTAKDVIMKFTGLRGVTVHQLLGLKPDVNLEYFNPANPIYAQLNEDFFMKEHIKLVLIDESSMLGKQLVTWIKERSLDSGIKVLFIGEPIADVKPL